MSRTPQNALFVTDWYAETDELLTDPVATGAGSEEIWRKRAPERAPGAKP